jgi:hypothetical protein
MQIEGSPEFKKPSSPGKINWGQTTNSEYKRIVAAKRTGTFI